MIRKKRTVACRRAPIAIGSDRRNPDLQPQPCHCRPPVRVSRGTGDLPGIAVGGAVADRTAVTCGVSTGTYVGPACRGEEQDRPGDHEHPARQREPARPLQVLPRSARRGPGPAATGHTGPLAPRSPSHAGAGARSSCVSRGLSPLRAAGPGSTVTSRCSSSASTLLLPGRRTARDRLDDRPQAGQRR